jgi:hypothetical protein
MLENRERQFKLAELFMLYVLSTLPSAGMRYACLQVRLCLMVRGHVLGHVLLCYQALPLRCLISQCIKTSTAPAGAPDYLYVG